MKKISLFCITIFTAIGSLANSNYTVSDVFVVQQSNEITATISKNTSETQFNDLVTYFKENEITLNLTEVNYNTENEITSINISLEKEGQNSNYTASSNQPISDIELGYKNNSLFITANTETQNINDSLSGLLEQLGGTASIDSLLTANPFSFNFSNTDLQDLINSSSVHFNLDDLMNDFLGQTNSSNAVSTSSPSSGLPKYNFINTPGAEKLIIIDGKESDFDTLNQLAINDQLDEVDNLKIATAVSLYGKKAKDGAIIATTKK